MKTLWRWLCSPWSPEARCRRAMRHADRLIDKAVRLRGRV